MSKFESLKKKKLAVIGAGPKGIAVAVKAKVLAEFGFPVDEIVLIEKNEVGANWSGTHGYTNGEMKLGTSPEKDVVFPIETDVGDDLLNARIRSRLLDFTWTSFLVQNRQFSDWVDRGRPAPCHQLWSMYLKWVFSQMGSSVTLVKAELKAVDLIVETNQWDLVLKGENEKIKSLLVDRLMLTGPGKTRMDFGKDFAQAPGERIFDLESFWNLKEKKQFASLGKIAVVGVGENAASVLLSLHKMNLENEIEIISPRGFLSTRSENFYENQIYSQPERNSWDKLELEHRMEFVERTDLGVFSVHAMQILNSEQHHKVVAGRVVSLKAISDGVEVEIEYGGKKSIKNYGSVILATGFDQVALIKNLFSLRCRNALEKLSRQSIGKDELMQRISEDLSIAHFSPPIHLPMLSGLVQGPGFSNLSCLGRLSDRVVLIPALEKLKMFEQSKEKNIEELRTAV
jgi:mycobactin lysine-N-oxygenase